MKCSHCQGTGIEPTNGHDDLRFKAMMVLDFLNDKAGRNFQPLRATLDPIMARLKEGATVTQCKAIISRKVAAWGEDPKMAPYLRPATLFNATKFSSYQGELPASAFQVKA